MVGAPSHGLSRLKMYCDRISNKVINKIVNYNHFADKTEINKYKFEYKLKNINLNLLPQYLRKINLSMKSGLINQKNLLLIIKNKK